MREVCQLLSRFKISYYYRIFCSTSTILLNRVSRSCPQRGVLPKTESLQWPQEPFASEFAATLSDLEMPRFCRRYPALLTTLMKQMLDMVQVRGRMSGSRVYL